MNARQAAVTAIEKVVYERCSLNTVLEPLKAQIPSADRALYQMLVYSTLRRYRALSSLRDSMLQRPLPDKSRIINIVLNLGINQLLTMNLGDHGVINETVKLATYCRKPHSKGLINALLRRVQRERPLQQQALFAAAEQDLPAWLYDLYPQQRHQIAVINSNPPPLTLRLHHTRNRQAWLTAYPGTAVANALHPQAITLKQGANVGDIPGFDSGIISIQDAAAQHAATLLNPQNHEHILDACSAPGGKTGHILELAPQATLDALDHSQERLNRVQENLNRLQCCARLIHADAGHTEQWWDGHLYDAILLDAPCSGSGILRRHPDITFLRLDSDLTRLARTQQYLLQKLWALLKPGGRLLYTTCSVLPQENQEIIRAFLTKTADARLSPAVVPESTDTGIGTLHLPDDDGDGFFYALLTKTVTA